MTAEHEELAALLDKLAFSPDRGLGGYQHRFTEAASTIRQLSRERAEARKLAREWVKVPPAFEHSADETEVHLFAMYLYATKLSRDLEEAQELLRIWLKDEVEILSVDELDVVDRTEAWLARRALSPQTEEAK